MTRDAASFLSELHSCTRRWLDEHYPEPTNVQAQAWPVIAQGDNVLVAAPTGSGKTLCAFINAIDDLVWQSEQGPLPDATFVLYVSPLKALSRDIEHNLQHPLSGISSLLAGKGTSARPITSAVRTGDTSSSERARQARRPAHILVTTPESLYILLTSESGRRALSTVRTVIVDEIHAVVRDKRGSHLSLSLERLDDLLRRSGRPRAQRIGLSATQKPIEEIARFLVGVEPTGQPRACRLIDVGHRRSVDLQLWVPEAPLAAVMSAEAWSEVYDQIAELALAHRTTLVFANTRRLVERIARFLSERLGVDAVTSHHGSLSQERRLAAEKKLKSGEIKVLVASASLELGIDVGDVDLVCQIASPRSISALLQRVGRSGHWVGGLPKGRLFPTTRDDLVECVALLQTVHDGELDAVELPLAPLDILAQQLVASLVPHEWPLADLYDMVVRSASYSALTFAQFTDVVVMLADGFATARGRRGALVHLDRVGGRVKARRNARIVATTNGGAIVDNFDYDVLLAPQDLRVGSVHEDFAIESSPGDVFQLGNTSYEILKVESGSVLVRDAEGALPSLPFWLGEAPGRTEELSRAVSTLRAKVASTPDQAVSELATKIELNGAATRQLVDYLSAAHVALGHMPTRDQIVAERFFDAAGNMHVVIHSPHGMRLNRGFGLALRKRFCRTFNVELQAAATDDAIVLSLGPTHSFALEELFTLLRAATVEDVLIQAVLDAPLFTTRFRWNASRALAVQRFRSGKRVAPKFQRIDAADLLAVCFPDQVACAENIGGRREIPEHPLVHQTLQDCLREAMDIDGLLQLLEKIEAGTVRTIARDLTEPSPLAHEVINARPYAFLDDAPLEERRTQAIQMRHNLSQPTDLAALDPRAIEQVLHEVAPAPRDADELHDALLVFGYLRPQPEWTAYQQQLEREGRLHHFRLRGGSILIAHERLPWFRATNQQFHVPGDENLGQLDAESALVHILRSRLELCGPVTAAELAAELDLPVQQVHAALTSIEGEGFALRGRFRPQATDIEFCERRLLARIHRLTLNQLRREIEPVTLSEFVDFLTHHQCLQPDTRKAGRDGALAVIQQLSGVWAAAQLWQTWLLPGRVKDFNAALLDHLTRSGQATWRAASGEASYRPRFSAGTSTTIASRELRHIHCVQRQPTLSEAKIGADARLVLELLGRQGALFFDDLKLNTRLLPTQLEGALSELLATGLITCDSFAADRHYFTDTLAKRRRTPRVNGPSLVHGLPGAGRFSRIPSAPPLDATDDAVVTRYAFSLLERWGVVSKRILDREQLLLPWGELRRVFSRLEARGEIRGGRFVQHLSGEQFATKDAIAHLRQLRKIGPSENLIVVSSYDPLNLRGYLDSEPKLPKSRSNQLLLLGGRFIASNEAGVLARFLETQPESALSDDTIAMAFDRHQPKIHATWTSRTQSAQ